MNRRNFLRNILVAGAAFNILPGAGRLWKAERQLFRHPQYLKLKWEVKGDTAHLNFVNAFFYNKPLSIEEKAKLDSWENIDADFVIQNGSIYVRANPEGLQEQLEQVDWREV